MPPARLSFVPWRSVFHLGCDLVIEITAVVIGHVGRLAAFGVQVRQIPADTIPRAMLKTSRKLRFFKWAGLVGCVVLVRT